jgi:hypothetical protein
MLYRFNERRVDSIECPPSARLSGRVRPYHPGLFKILISSKNIGFFIYPESRGFAFRFCPTGDNPASVETGPSRGVLQ